MKKAVVLALTLIGITYAQQTQSGVHEVPNFEVSKHRIGWCKQNWEKCRQRKLERLSMKKECLEKSQSFEDYKGCMTQFRIQKMQ
jgi:hypothetical protein